MKEMPASYQTMLTRLEQKERRREREPAGPRPLKQAGEQLEGKVPDGVRRGLETGFQKAFALLFGPGGTRLVERTLRRETLARDEALWHRSRTPGEERAALKRLRRGERVSRSLTSAAAGAEGAVLGLLGIGLPDIPVFLGVLLRGLYESARRYGFSYESPKERCYLLLVLQGALAEGEERAALGLRADRLGRALDHGWEVSCSVEEEIAAACRALAGRLLTAKFVQGIPLVGAVGGAVNLAMYRRVAGHGALKYRKRFLEKRVRGI